MEGNIAENLDDVDIGTVPVNKDVLESKPKDPDGPHLLGVDELNLAEFPLAACGYKVHPDQKTLLFEDTIFDEGQRQPVKRRLIIAASDAWGLPTPTDSDVLLVLMHLTRVRNGFTSRQVTFSRYELIQLLGWNDGGRSYQRLEQALQRWTSVTLSYNKAWWDRTSQVWRTRTFHVIESLDLRGRVGNNADDMQSSITWNEVLFGSFQANNIKRLDLTTYFQLGLPVARQMYRFLDKRFHRSGRLTLDLKYFGCEHVGLSRNYDNSQLQRRLLPALRELESIGFLVKLRNDERFIQVRRGEWKILLIANPHFSKQTKPIRASDGGEEKRRLQTELVKRGVSRRVAAELVAGFSPDHIRQRMQQVDQLVSAKDKRVGKNSAGFLVTAIRENYQTPNSGTKVVKCTKQATNINPPQRSAKEIQIEKLRAEEDAALDKYLAGLSADQIRDLEEAALGNGTRTQIESYYRLEPKGGQLFESLRRQLIKDYQRFTNRP